MFLAVFGITFQLRDISEACILLSMYWFSIQEGVSVLVISLEGCNNVFNSTNLWLGELSHAEQFS